MRALLIALNVLLLAAIIGVAGVLVFPGIISKLAGALSVAPINDLWVPGPPA